MLKIDSITRIFEEAGEKLTVLENLSFDIKPGEKVALMGASGAGKTTLLQIIGGLDTPTKGHVFINDQIMDNKSSELKQKAAFLKFLPRKIAGFFHLILFFPKILKEEKLFAKFRNNNLGFIFQFHHLMTDFTALENVYIPGLISGKSKAECQKRAMQLLEEVGVAHRAGHHPGELSGGERQRVALARALFNDPALILADEPTGNLDRENREHFLALVDRLNKEKGQTFLIATHDDDVAAAMDYRLVLRDKKVYKEA